MSDKSTVTMLSEEFENNKTGEKVEGITIIVDGKLKEVLDLIKIRNNNYKEILRDALFEGINNLINNSNK